MHSRHSRNDIVAFVCDSFLEISQEPEQIVVGARQRGRKTGRGSVAGESRRGIDDIRHSSVHEIETACSMGMKIHDARHDVGSIRIQSRFLPLRDDVIAGYFRDAAVLYPHAPMKYFMLKNQTRIVYQHRLPRLSELERTDCPRRTGYGRFRYLDGSLQFFRTCVQAKTSAFFILKPPKR